MEYKYLISYCWISGRYGNGFGEAIVRSEYTELSLEEIEKTKKTIKEDIERKENGKVIITITTIYRLRN